MKQPPDPGATPREPRERILDAATELFARKGYGSTSTREVVEAAGVTKPTLYYWFANKEMLYIQCVELHMGRLGEFVDAIVAAEGTVIERLHAFVSDYIAEAERRPHGIRLLMTVKHPGGGEAGAPAVDVLSVHLRNTERLCGLLQEGVERGELRADLDARGAVLALIGTCNLYLMSVLLGRGLQPDYADSILDLFLHGVAPR